MIAPTDSEDLECGPIISIKMQSTSTSSVIAPTNSGDCERGPSRICKNNASIKSGINESARNGTRCEIIKTMLPTSAASGDINTTPCHRARVFTAKALPRMTITDVLHSNASDVNHLHGTSPDSMGSDASPIPATSPTNENQRFICPKEPKICRDKADENLEKALGKVPDTAHFDERHKRKTATLYVGNLNFRACLEVQVPDIKA